MKKKLIALAALWSIVGALLLFSAPARAQFLPTQCVSTALAGGTGDAITIPLLPCQVTTTLLMLTFSAANATSTPTISMAGQTPHIIVNFDGSSTAPGQFQPGQYRQLTYNGKNWIVLTGNNNSYNITGLASVSTNAALLSLNAITNTVVYRAGFYSYGDGGAAFYTKSATTCSLNTGAGDNGSQVQGAGGGCWLLSTQPNYDVRVWGADATGSTDSTAAIRAAIAASVPGRLDFGNGTYLFKSTVSSPYTYQDPPAVLVQNKSNFTLNLGAATINVDPSIALSCAFMFDGDTNYQVIGGTINGSRSGLSAGQENVGICTNSGVNFAYRFQVFGGNFGGNGAAYDGDWLVDGLIEGAEMNVVGQCFDFAFMKNVVLQNFHGYGADTNGASGSNEIGSKCVSNVYDIAAKNDNHTGVSFTDTDGVTVLNSSAANFDEGFMLASGGNYRFSGNKWYANVGCPTAVGTCLAALAGYGGNINYIATGSFSSVGFPPHNIVINGDIFAANGNSTQNGEGIQINANLISNSDVINNVVVNSSVFDNNYDEGIEAIGPSHVSNVTLADNVFTGANQTIRIGSNIITVSSTNNNLVSSLRSVGGTEILGANLHLLNPTVTTGGNKYGCIDPTQGMVSVATGAAPGTC